MKIKCAQANRARIPTGGPSSATLGKRDMLLSTLSNLPPTKGLILALVLTPVFATALVIAILNALLV